MTKFHASLVCWHVLFDLFDQTEKYRWRVYHEREICHALLSCIPLEIVLLQNFVVENCCQDTVIALLMCYVLKLNFVAEARNFVALPFKLNCSFRECIEDLMLCKKQLLSCIKIICMWLGNLLKVYVVKLVQSYERKKYTQHLMVHFLGSACRILANRFLSCFLAS